VVGQTKILPAVVREGYGLAGRGGCADAVAKVSARPDEETSGRGWVAIRAGSA
jgi:hypothetical protein